jgi:hypothetical protein
MLAGITDDDPSVNPVRPVGRDQPPAPDPGVVDRARHHLAAQLASAGQYPGELRAHLIDDLQAVRSVRDRSVRDAAGEGAGRPADALRTLTEDESVRDTLQSILALALRSVPACHATSVTVLGVGAVRPSDYERSGQSNSKPTHRKTSTPMTVRKPFTDGFRSAAVDTPAGRAGPGTR